jgi:hypothetical protein
MKQLDLKLWRVKFRRNWRQRFDANLILQSNISSPDQAARIQFFANTHLLIQFIAGCCYETIISFRGFLWFAFRAFFALLLLLVFIRNFLMMTWHVSGLPTCQA